VAAAESVVWNGLETGKAGLVAQKLRPKFDTDTLVIDGLPHIS
jgi:hypothetical protein